MVSPLKQQVYLYLHQFYISSISTRKYLVEIILLYIQNECKENYNEYVAQVCEASGIKSGSMKDMLRRTLKASWQRESAPAAWARYAGWQEPSPPGPDKAIRLLCEHFPAYLQEREKRLSSE